MKSQPAYARIRDTLASEITSGNLSENAQLPTERDMCEQYSVSRITIRHALTLLEKDGLIRKRQGQGIFVCPRKHEQSLDAMYTFDEELRRHNARPSWKLLSMELKSVGPEIEARLLLSDRALCYEIKRLAFADGKLYAYEEIHVPEALLRSASPRDVEQKGLYETILECSGAKATRANESLESVLATSDLLQLLERKGPLPLMKIMRTAYAGENPMEQSVRYILGDKYRFRLSVR